MRNNVTITGIMGSGKSRVANTLVANGWEVFKMARPLKAIVEDAFDLTEGSIETLKTSQIDFKYPPIVYAKRITMHVLKQMDFSEFGAKARTAEESARTMPIPSLGGISGEQMVFEVKDLLEELFSTDGTYRQLLQRLGTDLMRTWNPDIHIEFARNALKDKKKPQVIDDARFPNELKFVREEMESQVVWLHRPSLIHEDFHASETAIAQTDADIVVKSMEGELLDNATNFYIDKGYWPEELVM